MEPFVLRVLRSGVLGGVWVALEEGGGEAEVVGWRWSRGGEGGHLPGLYSPYQK